MATPPKPALAKWNKVRSFALGLPGAGEEFPWGDTVVKVNKKIFVFLGVTDGSYPLSVGVKLKDEAMHAHALSCPGAEPSGYGLGKAGWVQVPLAREGCTLGGGALRLGGGELPRHRDEEADRRARRPLTGLRHLFHKGPLGLSAKSAGRTPRSASLVE